MKCNSIVPRRLALAVLFLARILAPSLALLSCREGQAGSLVPVAVAVPPLEQNALLYVAESQQLFERNGLRVTIKDYDTGVETLNALLAGEADMAELAEFPVIKPVFEGQPLRIIAVNDRFENDYLLARQDAGIADPADLEGKKIGVIRGTILEFYLGRFLQLHDISLDDVTIVDTANTTQTTDAIVSGALDAVVAFEPHVHTIQSRLGEGLTVWPVQNDQLAYGVLVSNDHWLTPNSDTVKAFLKALAEAEDYIATHPDEAKAIVQSRLSLDRAYVDSIWSLHQFSLSLDFSLIIAMDDEARWLIDNGLVDEKTVPDFRAYIYVDGLRAVKPEAVTIIH